MFDLEEDRIVEELKRRSARRVLLQMPEGLKSKGFELAKEIERRAGVEVIVSGDPCYGACDLALYPMERVQADLLIHVGHAEIPGEGPENRVIYVEARANSSIEKPLKEALGLLEEERRIGLAASVQHMHLLDAAKRLLERNGKVVEVGRPSGWLKYGGQILGCDYGSALAVSSNVDAFLVIAGGDFHALGVPLTTGKRTVVVDPFSQVAKDVTPLFRRIMRQRWAAITKFKEARKVGVVTGLKSSQMNMALARRLKELLEQNGKSCIIISSIEVVPEALESFTDTEAFVEIACPRISIDDRQRYRKLVLNPEEAMIAIGKKSWEDYGKGDTTETWH